MEEIIVIGAGVGGLTTAAVLAKKGLSVTVLEAQTYPGGCAATFFSNGFRFDAGATLAGGFYPGGPMDLVGKATGIDHWPIKSTLTAMDVHLPSGKIVRRKTTPTNFSEVETDFGLSGVDFFKWQQKTADAMWSLAMKLPHWPPLSFSDLLDLGSKGTPWILTNRNLGLFLDFARPVSSHLSGASSNLQYFVDGQLLISAQTTSKYANALYGAAALDLPRRGVVHVKGGMGAISETLVKSIRSHGGKVIFRKKVNKITKDKKEMQFIETEKAEQFFSKKVIANLSPWNLADLYSTSTIQNHSKRDSGQIEKGWGAFVVYVGFEGSILPPDFPLHIQIIKGYPLGEGNSIFASISPRWDLSRAPSGCRALTLSTHTNLNYWWTLYNSNFPEYQDQKQRMTDKILIAAETAIPGLISASKIILPGTPITFERYTGRKLGWVGGFPQTNLFTQFPHKFNRSTWLVGDSIFPGQSTAAVALGGLRIAEDVIINL